MILLRARPRIRISDKAPYSFIQIVCPQCGYRINIPFVAEASLRKDFSIPCPYCPGRQIHYKYKELIYNYGGMLSSLLKDDKKPKRDS